MLLFMSPDSKKLDLNEEHILRFLALWEMPAYANGHFGRMRLDVYYSD